MSSGGQQAMRLAASETGAINPAVNLAQRSPTLNNLNLQLTAQQISRGHAFAKHGAQFGVRTPDEFARIIERAISNPTMVRNLSRGRVAYWHQSSATVVIRDPAAVDGGTAFIPSRGLEYFNSLR
jgi:filamentous hemagglutinin